MIYKYNVTHKSSGDKALYGPYTSEDHRNSHGKVVDRGNETWKWKIDIDLTSDVPSVTLKEVL